MNESSKRLFGTDGIRGIANCDPMTPEMSLKLGKALTYILKMEKTDSKRPRIVIGKDTRLSGYMFEQAMSAGIISMGADVLLVGPLPTPAISFLTVSMRADAGVVISASHNPFVDNGIKFFDRFGFKLPDKKELEIEELVLSDRINRLNVPPSDIGKAWRLDDAQGRYVVFVKNTFPKDLTLEGLKIILDCANGAAYKVSPIVFQELGAEVITIGVRPDGKNINTDCGSINPELLKRKVKDTGADLGIALDGDADRVIFCDEKGEEVDGDIVIAITADEMIRNNKLQKNTVVTTIMSNMSLETFIREKGGIVIRTPVGDRYVVEEMRIRGCNFGGEKSGHMIFLDHTTTGDGTLAALQLLAVMKRKEKKLSELAKIIELYPQVLLNVKVREKKPFQDIPQLEDLLLLSEQRLKERGRINLRYSGTESLARIMVEGENEALVYEVAEEIAYRIQQAIGE
ncbi:MAG: phosphoglucosamine mutase, phosphoglucosamine mutase [Candidatus Dadabacteria bacterium CSP1-2]|nr:MAG: phosphoglucosamine mutase, phosphoglucosamine mutase [Candidatus Dadabacteria bacterium CSP1-2]